MPANPSQPSIPALSHAAPDGSARMVDVGDKPITERAATAEGFVRVSHELAVAIEANTVTKGSVLEVARLAAIIAAKRTDELIPLCHTLPLEAVDVSATLETAGVGKGPHRVRVVATVRTRSRTGVEMEALTAVCVACLTVIDMGKAIDKAMFIEGVRVLEKHGGRSGSFIATSATPESSAEDQR